MSFNVVVTDGFKKHAKGIAKKHRSLKPDLDKLIGSLEENPTQGEALGKDSSSSTFPETYIRILCASETTTHGPEICPNSNRQSPQLAS